MNLSPKKLSITHLHPQFVNLNLQSQNLKDVRVRQALSMVIDRDTIW